MHADTLKFYKYVPTKKPIYKDKFCWMPYHTLSIDEDGDVQLCDCALHMPYTVGNIYQQSLTEIWQGSMANDVRQAVVDGDFTYCNWACSKLATLTPKAQGAVPTVLNFPRTIQLDMDRSCNLKCPSCREQVIIEKQSDKIQQQVKIFEEIRQWALDNPKVNLTLIPVSSGEVFASHSALEFLKSLQDYPLDNLKLHLTSNGTLIKKNQQLIFNLKHLITSWSISVDAATPETYAKVRGGNWDDLMHGLDIINDMQISPVFKFCIQKNNYHEIEKFAELAVKYQAKSINYQKLMDWGHWDIQWWYDQNVFDRTRTSFNQALTSLQTVIDQYGSLITLAADLSKYLERAKESP